ncbi:putative glycosidase CRH2 [Rhodosporidiobolus nylandii]
MTTRFALLLPVLAGARAAIVATAPGGPDQVFSAGGECKFSYELDTTGTWKSMDVDLMSGSDLEMINVTRVASGLDATTGEGEYNFTCPEVDPPAPIYFYQFTQDGKDAVWTSRFTLEAANGTKVAAPNATQPDGKPVPWGIGHLVNSTTPFNPNSLDPFATNATDKPLDNPVLPSSLTAVTSSPTQWWTPTQAPGSGGEVVTTTAPGGAQPTATGISGFQEGAKCGKDSLCPAEAPCCSEYGFCGTGRNCLAGCDPLSSFQPGACAPVPACQSGEYQINWWNRNHLLPNSSRWNGDAQSYDWVVDSLGKPGLGALTADGLTGSTALTLSLTEQQNGTVITSTRSIYYGNVTAKIKSFAGSGILTAWTTNATDLAQTAFFSQGDVADYVSGQEVNTTDRAGEFHDYTISWMPDAITWLFDGVPVRNVSKNTTVDPENPAVFHYPQTPSRIRFSIWGAGVEGASEGLLKFVGGKVDWNASEYAQRGYYASYVSGVSVDCYDTSLLPNFASAVDPSASEAFNASAGLNGPSSVVDPDLAPPQTASLADAAATSTSTTAWWTPPTTSESASSSEVSVDNETVTTTSATAWWTPAVRKLRRRLHLEKVKRADTSISSYSYGDLDENGQVGVSGGQGSTTIANDAATGLDLTGLAANVVPSAGPSDEHQTAPTATSADSTHSSPSETNSAAVASATGETVRQKWDSMSTAAHVGIYIGAAAAALFLLVLVGWIWRKAASSRAAAKGTPPPDAGGAYSRINDQGEMLATGPIYSGSGEIQPGEQLYAGGIAPAAAAAAAPLSRKSTSSSTNSKFQGGYIPSSQLQQQYGLAYQPQVMKQV